jgi:uncharacterized SAM-binding protein YcdF (DUF218 family)
MILVSGGDPAKHLISEAEVMQRELGELGIPAESILLEAKSKNTYENAKFASAMLHVQKRDTYVLVTSGFHMKRSLLYFSHFGIHPIAAPSDRLHRLRTWLPLSYHAFLTDLAWNENIGILQFYFYEFMGWNQDHSG